LRVDDYRFYGELCLAFGILLIVIGIILPLATIRYYTLFGSLISVESPYLGYGIVMVIIGIILIVLSQILHREYKVRANESSVKPLPIPPPPPPPS
jgi:hypothetical protein